MLILTETSSHYCHTIKIMCNGKHEIRIIKHGIELYNGIAKQIIDNINKISFIDVNGKQHEYVKNYLVRTT